MKKIPTSRKIYIKPSRIKKTARKKLPLEQKIKTTILLA